MRWKLLTCALVSSMALAACSGKDNGGDGDMTGDGDGDGDMTGDGDGDGDGDLPGDGDGDGTGGMGGGPSSEPVDQTDIDVIGATTEIEFEVIENIPMMEVDGEMVSDCPASAPWGLCLDAVIRLKNTGDAWNKSGWAIYYSGIRKVHAVAGDEFTITHINGDLHKIEPTSNFAGFDSGETKEIMIKAEYWMISETDVMPRFYVAADGLDPAVIANTDTEMLSNFVAEFTTDEQLLRTPDDKSIIATALTRFEDNADVTDLGEDAILGEVVPSPVEVTAGTGTLDLSGGVTITAGDLSPATVAMVKARLAKQRVTVRAVGGVPVSVSVNASDPAFNTKATAEAYTLEIDDSSVTIVGGDETGAFYGLQSFLALLPGDFTSNKTVPQMTIDYDAPRYGYRGVQIDVARNFHGPASILKVLDQMAAYKLNTLHLHLSDDEGWRLQIPGLPELTDVGGARCHDPDEETCLLPQLGSGPFADTSGTGYLTRDEFVQILEAAADRHIEVVPEFDMPGHARAAIKAMEVRAMKGDPSYLLSDPMDESEYLSIQNYDDGAINACMESTYTFLAKLMDEVKDMYQDAGVTLNTWHLGGDEVGAGAWTASPACDFLYSMSGEVESADDVHAYFVRRANELALARGFGIRGWSDGLRKTVVDGETVTKEFLDPDTDLLGNTVSANWWGTLFWWDNAAYKMANLGYQVILTSPDFLYFDHPYEADPKERGYYWATRYTDVEKLFSYIPGNLPSNSQLTVDRQGYDYSAAFIPTEENPTPVVPLDEPQNIIGMEGALWGETVRTAEQLDYMVFPRLLALAERAWHRAAWEPADGTDYDATIDTAALADDWERFANVLGHKELPKLDRAGVRYRIEVPGGRIEDGKLEANVAAPGLIIEYMDGDGDWVVYDAGDPPSLSETEIRARSSDGRVGRSVVVN